MKRRVARNVGRGNRRRIGSRLLGVGLLAAVAVVYGGCGPLAGIKNPFSKKEVRLPGERIAVITDPGQLGAGQVTSKPVSLPPARAGQPHLFLGKRILDAG